MRKYTKFLASLLIFTGCLQPQVEEPDFVKKPELPPVIVPTINFVEVATDQQYEKAKNTAGFTKTLEYFSAVWCGYCTSQTPIIKELAQKHKNVLFLKIDVDSCPDATKNADVKSLPTVVVNGKKFVGFTKLNVLEKELQ